MSGERFDNPGLFDYWFRCVNKFMPWIRKIHLLVSNIEQVPQAAYDCPNVNIVLHKNFIPETYLPTFNSTTIEMFLTNIPDLAEHFIYSNDDMFPIKALHKEDFFSEDKIKIAFKTVDYGNNMNEQFRRVCFNCYIHVCEITNHIFDGRTFYRPMHGFTPMIKSHCQECLDQLGPKIFPYVSAFRTAAQHNQYIYPLYEWMKYGIEPLGHEFIYTSLKLGGQGIANIINANVYQVICINDVAIPQRTSFHFNLIKDAFENILR